MLSEKYKPSRSIEFSSNPQAVAEILSWLKNWKNERKKALLIYGPTGTSKSTLMPLLAKEMGYSLVESNSSDSRSAKRLKEEFSASLQQQTLFSKGRLIVFDEVDGLSAGDRGGAVELLKLIEDSKWPIILIANDAFIPKLKALRQVCHLVQFKKIPAVQIQRILMNIAEKEKIKLDGTSVEVISTISRLASGDLKAAINDFEFVSTNKSDLKEKDAADLGWRDIERNIFDVLKIIFKTSNAKTAVEALDTAELAPDDVLQWTRENLPLEYTRSADLARGYDALSRADVFRGRILRQQYWGFQVYAAQLISAGVAVAKDSKNDSFVKYQYPSRIIALGRSKMMRAAEKEIAGALGSKLHCSRKVARQYLFLLALMEKKQPEVYRGIMGKIGVSESA